MSLHRALIFGLGALLTFSDGVPLFSGQTDVSGAGQTYDPFVGFSESVRATGLGGPLASMSGDAGSLFSNPASVLSLEIPELFVGYNQSILGINYDTMAFAIPREKNGYGVAAQYVDRGSFERQETDSLGVPVSGLGTFQYSTFILNGSYARRFERWNLGFSAKGFQDQLAGTTTTGWAGDIGLQGYSLLNRLDVGFALRNLGPSIYGFNLPRQALAGAALHVGHLEIEGRPLTLFAEINQTFHAKTALHFGAEYNRRYFWLRGGYSAAGATSTFEQFSLGAGLRVKGIRIDYAWKPSNEFGDQQFFGMSIGFGASRAERQHAAEELDHAMEKRAVDNAQRFLHTGHVAASKGQWDEAIDEYSKALTWDSKNVEAERDLEFAKNKSIHAKADQSYQLGLQAANEEQWLDAASFFRQSLRLVPDDKNVNRALEKVTKELQAPKKSNAPQDQKAEAAYHRGMQAFLDGDYEEALAEWKNTLHLNRNWPYLREYIEKAQKMQLQDELTRVKSEKNTSSDRVDILIQQAYTLYRLGQTDQAIEVWNKVLALDPSNADARAALKDAREKKALKNLNAAGSQPQRPAEELNSQGLSAYLDGHLEEAVKIWRRALAADPQNLRIKNNITRVEAELAARRAPK